VLPDSATLRFAPAVGDVHNTAQLGRLLYTDYILLFQTSGLVLLVAMIGAIVLTLRDRNLSRRQVIANQVGRTPADSLELVDVPRGVGLATLATRRPKPAEAPAEPAGTSDVHGGGHH
jgi:NADH-quinone oxidoreductase subunit J